MKQNIISRNIRAVVAFGDMIGSSTWFQRVNNQGLEYRILMDKMDDAISNLKKSENYFLKRLGDGYMIILNLDHASSLQVSEFLLVIWEFKNKMTQWIKEHPNPRPEGFRVRVSCGYMEEKLHLDKDTDYRGYHIGMTAKLLRVDKSIPFICHASIKEILFPIHIKKFGFKFTKITKPKTALEGIFEADMKELWEFKVSK